MNGWSPPYPVDINKYRSAKQREQFMNLLSVNLKFRPKKPLSIIKQSCIAFSFANSVVNVANVRGGEP